MTRKSQQEAALLESGHLSDAQTHTSGTAQSPRGGPVDYASYRDPSIDYFGPDALLPRTAHSRRSFLRKPRNLLLCAFGLLAAVALALLIVAIFGGFRSGGKGGEDSDDGRGPPGPVLAPTVLLISFDGFRHDYLDRLNGSLTPNLNNFFENGGVRIRQGLKPVFQTKTFPLHFTLVTGQYEEEHGIVGNQMYDPVFDAKFDTSNTETRWWNGSEPLWVRAAKQGMKTATYFWPGSGAEIHGERPTYWLPYNFSTPFEDRVDQVLEWIDLPGSERPQFITLYCEEPDDSGHTHGPESPEVNAALQRMDGVFERLLKGLERRKVLDQINVIVTADHGMVETNPERRIGLQELITSVPPTDYDIVDMTPVAAIRGLVPGAEELIYEDLKRAADSEDSHFRVWKKSEIPERLRFRNHRRIQPIIVLADEGWSITRSLDDDPSFACCGAHGYDNELPNMRPFFIARGPGIINPGKALEEELHSLDVYLLITRLLGLTPQNNSGSEERVKFFLRNKDGL